jgi:hypothetical protein
MPEQPENLDTAVRPVPVQLPVGHSTDLPNGLTLVQQNPDCAVDLRSASRTYGWLFIRGPERGQWVTHRKLEPWEIMQAEDQRDYGIVQQGTKVRAG